MHLLNSSLASLATLSGSLLVWQWLAARRFPLHQKCAVPGFAPAISILKPLKGADDTTADSLRSWFRQDYAGEVEIIFGVADAADPAGGIVRQLMAEHPGRRARLVVCGPLTGANAKVAKLAVLEPLAAHALILLCDADVRVPADFLADFVAPLRAESCALVNCFYRLANPVTLAMRWEALAVNGDFWSQVLQAQTLKPLDFALGAAILVRREALRGIGGFAALADCLADDYQLGQRIARNGGRIALSSRVVECWDAPQNWTQVWKHQIRWARTVRVCQPVPYFFSILSNASLWPALWLLASLLAGTGGWAWWGGGCFLGLRVWLAWDLQRRFTPGRKLMAPGWMALVKDALQVAIWLAAFLGTHVEWRGRKMAVRRDGTLQPL